MSQSACWSRLIVHSWRRVRASHLKTTASSLMTRHVEAPMTSTLTAVVSTSANATAVMAVAKQSHFSTGREVVHISPQKLFIQIRPSEPNHKQYVVHKHLPECQLASSAADVMQHQTAPLEARAGPQPYSNMLIPDRQAHKSFQHPSPSSCAHCN
jgi:hypothetical protein